eukprot:c22500_g1_i1 orf=338-1381(-)
MEAGERKGSSKRSSRRRRSRSSSLSDMQTGSLSSDQETSGEPRKRRKERKRKDKESKRRSKRKSEKERESRKNYKKEKRKKRRQRSEDSSSSDEEDRRKKRKLLKEAKEVLKKHKSNANGSPGIGGDKGKGRNVKELTEEDYYEKNKEFSTWIKEERGMYFSSLSSDETRKGFREFVQAWNTGSLPKKYYEGVESAPRTSHKWGIKEEKALPVDRAEEMEFQKKLEKSQRKKFLKQHEEVLDELLPKATGRDRILEKKSIQREQNRVRQESPELMRDGDLMGGGDDFKDRLAREQTRRDKKLAERVEAMKEKQSAIQEKEDAAMDKLRLLVNMAGGKITIPKRQDAL